MRRIRHVLPSIVLAALALALAAVPLAAQAGATSQPKPAPADTGASRPATRDTGAAKPATPPTAAGQPAAGAPRKATDSAATPRVVSLDSASHKASMRDRIHIVTAGAVTRNQKGAVVVPSLVLYLGGRAMKGTNARLVDSQPQTWEVQLLRDSAAKEEWEAVLGSPRLKSRKVRVGLGPASGPEYPYVNRDSVQMSLKIVRPVWFWTTLALWIALLVVFVVLVLTTGILRDSAPPPDPPATGASPNAATGPTATADLPLWAWSRRRAAARLAYANRPYSLGRSQMAFWFVVVTTAFLAIWLVTGDYSGVITWQSLLLLGLATSTGVAARIIESRRRDIQEAHAAEKPALEAAVTAAKARVTDPQALQDQKTDGPKPIDPEQADAAAALKRAEAELAALDAETPDAPPSRRFLRDILNDDGEPSLARFQHVAWTLILGAVYLNAAYQTLTLPTLEPVLLVLLGISGATYIGFKAAEDHT
jgi:hypothetical protein